MALPDPPVRTSSTVTRESATALIEAARRVGASLGFEPATAVADLGGTLEQDEKAAQNAVEQVGLTAGGRRIPF